MNVSNLQRRQRRKSTLGTHRGYSIGFPLLPEPTSQPCNADSNEDDLTGLSNFSNITFRSSRRSVLEPRNSRINSPPKIKEKIPVKILEESPPKVIEKSPPNKKLETIFSCSFEELETIMIANEEENSILATTLVDNTITEMNKSSTDKTLNKENIEICDNASNKFPQETVEDLIKLFDSMIDKNNETVIDYNKQMDGLRKHIEDTNKRTEEIKNMKRRLVENFNVRDVYSESKCQTFKPPRVQTEVIQDTRSTLVTSDIPTSPSKEVFRDIRSTIKFLKTPRRSRAPRSSVLLTPHSMSFCIKSQCEQLLE